MKYSDNRILRQLDTIATNRILRQLDTIATNRILTEVWTLPASGFLGGGGKWSMREPDCGYDDSRNDISALMNEFDDSEFQILDCPGYAISPT